MNDRPSLFALIREGAAVVMSRRLILLLIVAVVAVGVTVPLLISNQAEQSRESSINLLDGPEMRTIRIVDKQYGDGGEPLSKSFVEFLLSLSAVEDMLALGELADLRSARGWPNTPRIPTVEVLHTGEPRDAALCDGVRLRVGEWQRPLTLHGATEKLYLPVVGIREGSASVAPREDFATRSVCQWTVARQINLRLYAAEGIEPFVELISRRLGTRVAVSTPDNLESVRSELDSGLSSSARRLSLMALVMSGLLCGSIFSLHVTVQVKHFARRRALGAARSDIAVLIVSQIVIAIALGIGITVSGHLTVAAFTGYRLDTRQVLAVSVILLESGMISALPAAIATAAREPARRLRVP